MEYKICGNTGLKLPVLSLGLWHNFGETDDFENSRQMICYAFDRGVTYFDLANNYGTPQGSAEETFGLILKRELLAHRDEMIISSKAGHMMWEGLYGDGGSRKYLMASINQSLKRTGLDYFDIFYSHRYDPETPLEETIMALIDIVKQGKALYVGISKYPPEVALKALVMLRENKVPCLAYQGRYSMLSREVESHILSLLQQEGCGFIGFSPLAQGLLSDRYLTGIPLDSRAAKVNGYLKKEQITEDLTLVLKKMNLLAQERGQTLAQMALSWILKNNLVTSTIIGASSVDQIQNNLQALKNIEFSSEELSIIQSILSDE